MRKAFNFYTSYWEVACELSDKDRLLFYDALIKRQFTGIETELTGMVKFAYLSQKHSIDKQIKGYFDKTKDPTFNPLQDPCQGGTEHPIKHPSVQEKEKEKEKEKEELNNIVSDETSTFNSESQNKTLTDKEIIEKFISWFNKRMVNHKGKEGKFKKLDKTDLNNYKELLKIYPDGNDWVHAFNMMMESEWIKANDTASPKHFLINANFQNYVNKTSSKQKSVYIPQNDLN